MICEDFVARSLNLVCKLIRMFHKFIKQTRSHYRIGTRWFAQLQSNQIWCEIPGFPKYEACNDGRVRLKRTKRVLIGQHNSKRTVHFFQDHD